MTCFLHIETPDKIFEKICQTKIFSMLLENFLATFFCCSNKKQQIFWQVKLWGFVAFCRSNKIFSPNFFSTSCGCTRKKFLARAHSNTSKFWPKMLKNSVLCVFFGQNFEVLECARAKNFSRVHPHDVEEHFGKKILLLRQNATTPHNFTCQKICCFLLPQQKMLPEKFLVWQIFSKTVSKV